MDLRCICLLCEPVQNNMALFWTCKKSKRSGHRWSLVSKTYALFEQTSGKSSRGLDYIKEIPSMAIGIEKAVLVHEPMILRLFHR